jgi:hypothetical protein
MVDGTLSVLAPNVVFFARGATVYGRTECEWAAGRGGGPP